VRREKDHSSFIMPITKIFVYFANVTIYLPLMTIKDSFTGYMLVYSLQKVLALAMEFSEGLVTF
jgi:hypothetical protein